METKKLKESLVELDGRQRAKALLDAGTFRELLGPFDQLESPHLEKQGIVPQSDDGVIIARGKIDGEQSVVISIEGNFQGGGIGEVSGAKIAGAFELALRDNEKGIPVRPVLLFDTGGVRLQEANYGLLSIAEIGAAIVALREYLPVIGVVPGKIGSFGGMSIIAGLFSTLIMTRESRIALNGPEVIEQEAGIEEFDSRDRQLIWNTIGGEQRTSTGFADELVEDDIPVIKKVIEEAFVKKVNKQPRSSQVNHYYSYLKTINPEFPIHPLELRDNWEQWNLQKSKREANREKMATNSTEHGSGRGKTWFQKLTQEAQSTQGEGSSVLCAEILIEDEPARIISVVPNSKGRFPRARKGEVGLEEAWTIAKYVREAIEEDKKGRRRAIIALVDVPSQAYGYNEELLGIHQACAAAADAYATARLTGHPVISLIVGNAISGAFLAHGMQSNRLLALDDSNVNVHVMSKNSAARITRRSIDKLEEATKKVPAMAYDIHSFASLGALHELIQGVEADEPGSEDVHLVTQRVKTAIKDVRKGSVDLRCRLESEPARQGGRRASILVREKLAEQW